MAPINAAKASAQPKLQCLFFRLLGPRMTFPSLRYAASFDAGKTAAAILLLSYFIRSVKFGDSFEEIFKKALVYWKKICYNIMCGSICPYKAAFRMRLRQRRKFYEKRTVTAE